MSVLKARVSEDLAARFDVVAGAEGGRSALLRRLVEDHLATVAPTTTPPAPLMGRGQSDKITLRLRPDEMEALDAVSAAAGFRRATWIRALVRRRLLGRPVMNDAQAHAFRGAQRELHRIGVNVNQIARAMNTAVLEGALVASELRLVLAAEQEIKHQVKALRDAFRGNLDYWDAGE